MSDIRTFPQLLKPDMVRATLDNRKTMTRRLPNPQNALVDGHGWPRGWVYDFSVARIDSGPSPAGNDGPYIHARRAGSDTVHRIYPKYRVGDLLWIRETFRLSLQGRGDTGFVRTIAYRADADSLRSESECVVSDEHSEQFDRIEHGARGYLWRSSIHMPRWASRLTLRITEVRVERVQDISEDDIYDEIGPPPYYDENDQAYWLINEHECYSAVDAWEALWDSINAKRGFSWASNPAVFVFSFESILENVDRYLERSAA